MLGEGIVGAGVAVNRADHGDVVVPELGFCATKHQQHQGQGHCNGSRHQAARHCGHGFSNLGRQSEMEIRLVTEGKREKGVMRKLTCNRTNACELALDWCGDMEEMVKH
jgi:hypothetical protein